MFLIATVFADVSIFLLESGTKSILTAFTILAVGSLVLISTAGFAEIDAGRVGKKLGVDNFEVFFGDRFGVVAVGGEKTFFEGVKHGVDSNFALFVTLHGVDVEFLGEKNEKEEGGEGYDDEKFENSEG